MSEIKIQYGITSNEVLSFTMIVCGGCGYPFMIPTIRYHALVQNKGAYTCPNGCSRQFCGKSDAEKLREEFERYKHEARIAINEQVEQVEQLNRKLNRVKNGVCPCCNRSFKDLARHMKTKHSVK